MRDIKIHFGSFSSTSVLIEALTEKGREAMGKVFGTMSGCAPVSVNVRKSMAGEANEKLLDAGATIEVI